MTVPTGGVLLVKLKTGVPWIATLALSGAPMETVGVAGAAGAAGGGVVVVVLGGVLLDPLLGAAPPPPPPEQAARKETSRHEAACAPSDLL